MARLRVLTWNLKHGLAVPGAGRDLLDEFSAALSGWDWDVALLQEVPPWWPPLLVRGAGARSVLTSRNLALPLRRAIATRWPDLIKSNGGGANAILVRGPAIVEHRAVRLTWLPERRWMHAVRLRGTSGPGAGSPDAASPGAGSPGAGSWDLWAGNLHASGKGLAESGREFELARRTLLGWAGELPAVLGGDFNVKSLYLPGFARAGGSGVDHVFASGLRVAGDADVLERGRLSDHAPVRVTVAYDG